MYATPVKLRDGSWGARVPGKAQERQRITIRTKTGKSWEAQVVRVLWTGTDKGAAGTVSLCATRSIDGGSHRKRSRSRWTGCSCGSREDEFGEVIPSPRNCRACNFEACDM